MGDIYREYISTWEELGGDLFVHFNDISEPSKWGSFGSLESVFQDGSPKYDALLDLIGEDSSGNLDE